MRRASRDDLGTQAIHFSLELQTSKAAVLGVPACLVTSEFGSGQRGIGHLRLRCSAGDLE